MAKKQMSNEILYAVVGLIIGIVLAIFIIGPMMTPTGQAISSGKVEATKTLGMMEFERAAKLQGAVLENMKILWGVEAIEDYKRGVSMDLLSGVVYYNEEFSPELTKLLEVKLKEAALKMKTLECAGVQGVECMKIADGAQARLAVMMKEPLFVRSAVANVREGMMADTMKQHVLEIAPIMEAMTMQLEADPSRTIVLNIICGKSTVAEFVLLNEPESVGGIVVNSLGTPDLMATEDMMGVTRDVMMDFYGINPRTFPLVSGYETQEILASIVETRQVLGQFPLGITWNPLSNPVYTPTNPGAPSIID